jgi:NAD(P)-dependent dehydrogenase (short-subunit alcohol dehydrogenase family)
LTIGGLFCNQFLLYSNEQNIDNWGLVFSSNFLFAATSRTSMDNLDMEDFDVVMATNLRGTVLSLKYAAKAMIPAKQGVIICTASIAGMLGGMTAASYAISKAAIIAAVHCASAELSQHGIRVNTISPFSVATPLTLKSFRSLKPDLTWEELEEVIKKLNNQELAGSILTPESVADAALFLASSESAFMSGHNLVLDGGFSIRRGPAQYNL